MMECNRDEAMRARGIAERKFGERDVAGAKKFALKAQNLYPALEGIEQMVATLEVHLASEAAVDGEKDWYAILDVSASADDEMVKKQYRKLALMLHPDKNKAVGAEEAFKLVSEAWSVLCDKARRIAYDQKRSDSSRSLGHGSQEKKRSAGAAMVSVPDSSTAPPPPPPQGSTFWTSCNNCKMQYEYLRIYVNHNLLCPNCHKPFLAVETANPANGHNSPVPSQRHHTKHAYRQQKSVNSVPARGSSTFEFGSGVQANGRNFQSVAFSKPPGSTAATYPAQSTNVFFSVYGKVQGEEEHAHNLKRTASFSEVDGSYCNVDRTGKRRRGIHEDARRADFSGANWGVKDGTAEGHHANINLIRNMDGGYGDHGKFRTYKYGNLKRELSHVDVRGMLMRKGTMLVKRKLEDLGSETSDGPEEKENRKQKQRGSLTTEQNGMTVVAEDGHNAVKMGKSGKRFKKSSGAKSIVGSDISGQESMHIDVPDPDFYDFDKDRSEECFEPDQVWATYDDEDGMPRLYALVQKVVSLKPFKIRMSFLTSKSNSELGPLNWVGMGFAKTCGDFRVSRYAIKDSINIFSHKIRWEKGLRGVIKIIPKKGETWALYRNWSPDWNEHTPDDEIYKYDMVEVLDDYNDQGVSVVPLVKVDGFKTVFHRHMDENEIRTIPREEMFRFSHQVPSCFLTGTEAKNAPKGCHELDPAATPLELLQVITEAKENDLMGTSQAF